MRINKQKMIVGVTTVLSIRGTEINYILSLNNDFTFEFD